ncbi:MAG: hypothetical protein AAGJ93_01410, partial [Bacteroidota bacterium]
MKNQYFLMLLLIGAGPLLSAQTYTYIIEATSISWTGNYDDGLFGPDDEEYASTISGTCNSTTWTLGESSASATPTITIDSGSGMAGNTVSTSFNYEAWENDDTSESSYCENDSDCLFCNADNDICSGTFSGSVVLPAGLGVGAIVALPAAGGSNICSDNDGTFTVNTVQVRITAAMPDSLLSSEGEVQKEGVILEW